MGKSVITGWLVLKMCAYNCKSVKNRATAVVFSVNYVDCVVEMQRNGGREEWYFVSKIVLTCSDKKCSSDQEKLLKSEA